MRYKRPSLKVGALVAMTALRSAFSPAIPTATSDGTSPGILHVPADYASIQLAINASINGDTVLVSEGTYFENIRFRGKRILVGSLFVLDGDTAHVSRTIIDGSKPAKADSGSVVYFVSGEDTTSILCGFTVTGGTGTRGKFQLCPDLTDSARVGGAIWCEAGARICHNFIVRNSVRSDVLAVGGGIGAGSIKQRLQIIEGNVIAENEAVSENAAAGGGGIALARVIARVRGNTICKNTVRTESASRTANGGGVACFEGVVTIERNLIEANLVSAPETQAPGMPSGGGVLFQARMSGTATVDLNHNSVLNNKVLAGNACMAIGGGIGIVSCGGTVEGRVSGNVISSNTVAGGGYSGGGGIGLHITSGVTSVLTTRVENNIVAFNVAPYGGGIRLETQSPTTHLGSPLIVNNTVTGNQATSRLGGGVLTKGQWAPIVMNTIVWGDSGVEVYKCYGASIRIVYSSIRGGWPSDVGNVDANPHFLPGTFMLDDSSHCIGVGVDSFQIGTWWLYAPPQCIHGQPRPTPPGTCPDLGACESILGEPVVAIDAGTTTFPPGPALEQNFPNPWNPKTHIRYRVTALGRVQIRVYDLLGRETRTLVDEVKSPGMYTVALDIGTMASGLYFYRMEIKGWSATRRLVVLK